MPLPVIGAASSDRLRRTLVDIAAATRAKNYAES